MKILIGISGASGAIYGIRLLQVLQEAGHHTELIVSPWAEKIIAQETDYTPEKVKTLASAVHDYHDMSAPPASGSNKLDAAAIVPCSMKTLASIAHGYVDNLMGRTADVMLKERKKIIIVPRETPLNLIHIENMRHLLLAGAVLLPPMPSFYHYPENIDDIINHTVGKILDVLNIEHELFLRWRGLN
ncbi:MAG: UbiX family flavin prenyltransferase [Clostridiales bacterium]|nr:UbiX family flavin prenyltransferase [Clostridiales bacterium]MCF8021999.1 UbiX family flavin prenyltransferase [Clostridiales bacterium]